MQIKRLAQVIDLILDQGRLRPFLNNLNSILFLNLFFDSVNFQVKNKSEFLKIKRLPNPVFDNVNYQLKRKIMIFSNNILFQIPRAMQKHRFTVFVYFNSLYKHKSLTLNQLFLKLFIAQAFSTSYSLLPTLDQS